MIDVQHVEQLALVFVDALDLHVEQAVGADLDAGAVLDVCSEACLVGTLDCHEFITENGVIQLCLDLFEFAQIGTPA